MVAQLNQTMLRFVQLHQEENVACVDFSEAGFFVEQRDTLIQLSLLICPNDWKLFWPGCERQFPSACDPIMEKGNNSNTITKKTQKIGSSVV